jgi:hypothetical protein
VLLPVVGDGAKPEGDPARQAARTGGRDFAASISRRASVLVIPLV